MMPRAAGARREDAHGNYIDKELRVVPAFAIVMECVGFGAC